jgi:putative polyketide hydroxylase
MISECKPRQDFDAQVFIAGGSVVGLSAAAFLAARGIKPLLVERRSDLSRRLRAKVFYARTLELYRTIGIDQRILDAEPKEARPTDIAIVESLGGAERGRWSVPASRDIGALSPCRSVFIKQRNLEEIVRERARELGAHLCFGTELQSFTQDRNGVIARVSDRTTGEEKQVRAQYMIAADGNSSSVRHLLGIARTGLGDLSHSMEIRFEADLKPLIRGRPLAFVYVREPDFRAYIAWEADQNSGVVSVEYDPATNVEVHFSKANCRSIVARALGIGEGSFRVLGNHPWIVGSWVTERFREGRIFLAGDSAHVTPPAGGFGASLGVHDAHNLCTKLGQVLSGEASEKLLDCYEAERLPVAHLTVDQATSRFKGLRSTGSPETAQTLYDETAITLGYRYRSDAILSEDLETSPIDPGGLNGQPGTRAPHVAISNGGKWMSSLDLYRSNPVLIVGPQGHQWLDAGAQLAAEFRLDIHHIGADADRSAETFLQAHGISETGTILIRPDGFVAWRAPSQEASPIQELVDALGHVLARAPDTRTRQSANTANSQSLSHSPPRPPTSSFLRHQNRVHNVNMATVPSGSLSNASLVGAKTVNGPLLFVLRAEEA